MKTDTGREDKERMERFDGGGEGNNRTVLATVRGKHSHIAASQPS